MCLPATPQIRIELSYPLAAAGRSCLLSDIGLPKRAQTLAARSVISNFTVFFSHSCLRGIVSMVLVYPTNVRMNRGGGVSVLLRCLLCLWSLIGLPDYFF